LNSGLKTDTQAWNLEQDALLYIQTNIAASYYCYLQRQEMSSTAYLVHVGTWAIEEEEEEEEEQEFIFRTKTKHEDE